MRKIPLLALFIAGCSSGPNTSEVEALGATFTTTEDGGAVNDNLYGAKEDVYLDGGPGPNAPSSAAALDEGDYYFQVTDPSGKTLLSSDALECRQFHINADGVIDRVIGPCPHATGISSDHGGLTVQLFPYDDTPNNGGVYKAWVTPVDNIGPNGKFIHKYSKTDNFKVRVAPEDCGDDCPEEPSCGDGHVDSGEECDDGNTSGGDGCSSTCRKEAEPEPCCGDGHVDAGEECDDGNTTGGDGCSATCTTEAPPPEPCCGDGHLDAGEECDDGNTTGGDGCDSTCKIEHSCEHDC